MPAWENALAAEGPVLLEFMVDGDTPQDWAEFHGPEGAGASPLPHITGGPLRRKITAAVGGLFDFNRPGEHAA